MPRVRRRRRRLNRLRFQRRQAAPRGPTSGLHTTSEAPTLLRAALTHVHTPRETKDGWLLLPAEKKAASTKLLPMGMLRGVFRRFETRICYGGTVATSASSGKYILTFIPAGGSAQVTLPWTSVGNASEFNVLDQLFDEFFVRSARLVYKPDNKYNGYPISGSGTASSTNINTMATTLVFLPHNSAAYNDSNSAYISGRSAEQSAFLNTGDDWSFNTRNTEKFDWGAPLIDPVSSSTQGWCLISNTNKYGGFYQLLGSYPTGASPSPTVLPESATMGVFLLEFMVAFRSRA